MLGWLNSSFQVYKHITTIWILYCMFVVVSIKKVWRCLILLRPTTIFLISHVAFIWVLVLVLIFFLSLNHCLNHIHVTESFIVGSQLNKRRMLYENVMLVKWHKCFQINSDLQKIDILLLKWSWVLRVDVWVFVEWCCGGIWCQQ